MQSNRRTFASVVGTLTMVVLTLVAAWSSPQPETAAPTDGTRPSIVR